MSFRGTERIAGVPHSALFEPDILLSSQFGGVRPATELKAERALMLAVLEDAPGSYVKTRLDKSVR